MPLRLWLVGGLVGGLIGAAYAVERPLKGPEIEALLKGATAVGASQRGEWRQYFSSGGETDYALAGAAPSVGGWDVRGDKFCSLWPPNDRWTCYDVLGDLEADPKTVIWVGDGGARYPAAMREGKAMP